MDKKLDVKEMLSVSDDERVAIIREDVATSLGDLAEWIVAWVQRETGVDVLVIVKDHDLNVSGTATNFLKEDEVPQFLKSMATRIVAQQLRQLLNKKIKDG